MNQLNSSFIHSGIKVGNLQLDLKRNAIFCDSKSLQLSPKEYLILKLLILYEGKMLSVDSILEKAWIGEETPLANSVRYHIAGIRRKLRQKGAPRDLMELVYGCGYRLKK